MARLWGRCGVRLRVAWLPDGKKLHLRNGVIDLIVQAFGRPAEVGRAYDAAIARGRALVQELADDLPLIAAGRAPQSPLGRRAAAACAEVPGGLPATAALSGAVVDEMVAAMARGGQIERGYANNRGMVALYLAEGQSIKPETFDWPAYGRYHSNVPITTAARARGIASTGWAYDAGLAAGYVDRLHVAACSSAVAEVAAHSLALRMRPASPVTASAAGVPEASLAAWLKLGGMALYAPVTGLAADEVSAILAAGGAAAEALFAAGTIAFALLTLGEAHYLVARPNFSLKSMLSVEG